jgi:RNA polymerase sigma factor (sigma-70 family)
MSPPIRVTVVEDNAACRRSLVALIQGTPGFTCSGAHADASLALKSLKTESPDIILLDLELPGMSGDQFLPLARVSASRAQILVLTIHDEPDRLFRALEAGASGYLIKSPPPARLLESILEVYSGGSPMSASIARMVIRTFHERGRAKQTLESLSPREAEVLRLLALGLRYKEIATSLGISPRTVGTHIHRIYEKLHVRSATEASLKYRNCRIDKPMVRSRSREEKSKRGQ